MPIRSAATARSTVWRGAAGAGCVLPPPGPDGEMDRLGERVRRRMRASATRMPCAEREEADLLWMVHIHHIVLDLSSITAAQTRPAGSPAPPAGAAPRGFCRATTARTLVR